MFRSRTSRKGKPVQELQHLNQMSLNESPRELTVASHSMSSAHHYLGARNLVEVSTPDRASRMITPSTGTFHLMSNTAPHPYSINQKPSSNTSGSPRRSMASYKALESVQQQQQQHGRTMQQNFQPWLTSATEPHFSSESSAPSFIYGGTSHSSDVAQQMLYQANKPGIDNQGEEAWAMAHESAQPGIGLMYSTYLSEGWPPPIQRLSTPTSFQAQLQDVMEASLSLDSHATQQTDLAVGGSPAVAADQPTEYFAAQGSRTLVDAIDSEQFVECVEFWRAHKNDPGWKATRCFNPTCKTSKVFPTARAWLEHVRTVHYKIFHCDHDGCKLHIDGPTPHYFGSKSDLDRHKKSKHERPVYCNKPGCVGKEKLNRADKRKRHAQTHHGHLECPVPRCPRQHRGGIHYGFSTEQDLALHLQDKHNRAPIEDNFVDYDLTFRSGTQAPPVFENPPAYEMAPVSENHFEDSAYAYGDASAVYDDSSAYGGTPFYEDTTTYSTPTYNPSSTTQGYPY